MYEEKDLHQAKNLIKALKQGKWTLEGEEILAFQQMFMWTVRLAMDIEESLKKRSESKEVMSAIADAKTAKPKVKKAE